MSERVDQHQHRGDPAAPAGDDRAAVRVAGELPDRRPQHPAAVERQPGHQVEHADDQVGARPAPPRRARAGRRAATKQQAQDDQPDRQRGQRPDHRDPRTPARGRVGLAVDLGDAAEEVQGDRA